jgi:hypothetical protein
MLRLRFGAGPRSLWLLLGLGVCCVSLPARATPGEDCLRLAAKPPDFAALGEQDYRRAADGWALQCRQALLADADPRLKVALARALRHEQRPEQIALLRDAAAAGNAEAGFMLFDQHRSWDEHLDRPQLVSRAEADRALRRAAELGDPQAMWMLAILLERGGVVKRDPVAARVWAERTYQRPPDDQDRGVIGVLLGRLLAGSDQPAQRARGLAVLEQLNGAGTFGAASSLAAAIRRDDPLRARRLLEQALRGDPGGAIPLLAEMLSRGEGGPPDQPRANRLVASRRDIGAISGVHAAFILDRKLPPRDVGKAVSLLQHAAVWDYEAQLRLLRLLPEHPEVQVERPQRVLYDVMIAAELDEPGARDALIELRLSQHPQFRDRAEGCKLLQAAVPRGDPAAAARLSECSAP